MPPSERLEYILFESDKDDEYKWQTFLAYCDVHNKSGEIFRERMGERKKFEVLLDNVVITASEKGVVIQRDELFDDFARAHFSGAYLPLARKIEEIMGKGSFRKIAEDFKKVIKVN